MTRVKNKPDQDEAAEIGWQVPEELAHKWASRAAAAAQLKVSVDTIDRWVKEGKLTKRDYYTNHVLISKASIKALLAPFL